MTDYSLRMRCQAQTNNSVRCTRRGRIHQGEHHWFCWQHSAYRLRYAPDYRTIAAYPPSVMAG